MITVRNDNFSNKPFAEISTEELKKIPEIAGDSFGAGFAKAYLKPIVPTSVPAGPVSFNTPWNKSFAPALSAEYEKNAQKGNVISDRDKLARSLEDIVTINGRTIPGIFQGFAFSGGVITEKFDKQRHNLKVRGKAIKGAETAQLFQVDKGIRPIAGNAAFMLLDDFYSSAKDKAIEFINIVTDWEGGVGTGIPRVFFINSFLTGSEFSHGGNFTRVKIIDYALNMPISGNEGQIDATFQFEQFEILESEDKIKKPLTPADKEGSANTEMSPADDSDVLEVFGEFSTA